MIVTTTLPHGLRDGDIVCLNGVLHRVTLSDAHMARAVRLRWWERAWWHLRLTWRALWANWAHAERERRAK